MICEGITFAHIQKKASKILLSWNFADLYPASSPNSDHTDTRCVTPGRSLNSPNDCFIFVEARTVPLFRTCLT